MKKKLAHNSIIQVLFLQTAIMFWYAAEVLYMPFHVVIQNSKDMYSRAKTSQN